MVKRPEVIYILTTLYFMIDAIIRYLPILYFIDNNVLGWFFNYKLYLPTVKYNYYIKIILINDLTAIFICFWVILWQYYGMANLYSKEHDMCAFFARPRRPRVRGYTPIITSFLLSIIIIGRRLHRTRDGVEKRGAAAAYQ